MCGGYRSLRFSVGGAIERTAIEIISLVALLLPSVAGLSVAAEPEMFLPGSGGNTSSIGTYLWMDNPDFDTLREDPAYQRIVAEVRETLREGS